jgi:hypothetical protein
MAAGELLQLGNPGLFGVPLLLALEQQRQALEGGVLSEHYQGGTELVFAAQFGRGSLPAQQFADHLGFEGGRENASRAPWQGQDSLGASIHVVLVSPKGRSSLLSPHREYLLVRRDSLRE